MKIQLFHEVIPFFIRRAHIMVLDVPPDTYTFNTPLGYALWDVILTGGLAATIYTLYNISAPPSERENAGPYNKPKQSTGGMFNSTRGAGSEFLSFMKIERCAMECSGDVFKHLHFLYMGGAITIGIEI
eukprot:g19738.t1